MKENTVRTNSLISVMLNHDRFARKPSEKKRNHRGSRKMNNIRSENQTPELDDSWLPNHLKWQRTIVNPSSRCFGDNGNAELRLVVLPG
jgi:hypothetical protein